MSTFTIRLVDLVNDEFDFGMDTADYPIFDETHRAGLNQRILDHYAFYEIGYETPEMFRFALNRRLREIMPLYNKLYLSEQIAFDPLSTMDYTDDGVNHTTGTTDNTSNATNNNATEGRARSTNSELPQVHLSPDEDYASSGADTASNTTATGTADSTSTENVAADGTVTHSVSGYQGHAAMLLMQYRQSLLNIDMMVVQECANLFMGVWNTNDEYSTHGRFYGYGFTFGWIGSI